MGWWSEQVVPRVTDRALDTRELRELRRRALATARGTVVELGVGSGTNLPHYPAAVDRVLGVEPSAVAGRLGARRVAAASAAGMPVEHVGLDGAALPVPDGAADTVVSTFTLCTIPDLDTALGEVRRVLRPGGRFVFLEHGRAPEPGTARWQRRLSPLQQRLFAGCHLEREIDTRVAGAGLAVVEISRERMRGPRILRTLWRGVAVPV